MRVGRTAFGKESAPLADSGLSLVEIVVAMFLLALVSIAFLPLLINSLQLSIRNATTSTATQVLNGQLDVLTATAPTCAALTGFGSAAVDVTTDRRGVEYRPGRFIAPPPDPTNPDFGRILGPNCTSLEADDYPATVTVGLVVYLSNTDVSDVWLTTDFLLQEAG